MAIKKLFFLFLTFVILVTPLSGVDRVSAETGPNLLANGSAENATNGQPADWNQGGWGNNTRTFSYVDGGHSGSKSLQVTVSSYADGDAKWYANPVTVAPNTAYTYTDYYKSTSPTEVIVQFQDTAGAYVYRSLASPTAANDWAQTMSSFTTPANVKNVTIFHVIAGTGTLQLDDVALNTATVAPPVAPPAGTNLVPNNSLETANGAVPADWQAGGWGTNDRKFAYLGTGHAGNRSVEVVMTARTDGDASWAFASQPVTSGKQYTFSDYYKSNVATEVDAKVTLTDGTTQFVYLGTAVASSDWLRFERTFTAPANAARITVTHLLYQAGSLTTDDYNLGEYTIAGFSRALVSLTFDDSWRSIYANALPIMKKYGLASTQYLLSGNTDDPDYMTKAQMKAFATAGHEIASHTVSHPDLTTLTASQLTTELSRSKTNLQTWTGATVQNFASPYGAYNSTVLNAIKKYYGSHRGVEVGYNAKNNLDVYDIKVQNIVDSTAVADVAAWVAQAQKDKTWLVLVYHQISDASAAAGEYTTPVAVFDAQMKAVKSSGVAVKTVQQSLSEIRPQLSK